MAGWKIETEGLVKQYGSVEALRGISFRAGEGEVVGLLGPNGAGKTTLLKVLAGSHFPTAGTARIDGMDVTEYPRETRELIGYLPESVPLYPELSVASYLHFVAGVRGLSGNRRKQALGRAVESCGIAEVYYRPIGTISKGFRQRVGLAQAMLHDPQVLILDEPTEGLDPSQIVEIRELVRSIGTSRTVLLSSHILSEVEAVCSRVVILSGGRIAAQGTPGEITAELKGEISCSLVLKTPERSGNRAETKRIASRIADELSRERFIGKVAEYAVEDGNIRFELILPDDDAAPESIFDWSVSRNMKILRLSPRRPGLEEIFRSLVEEERT